MQVERVLSSWIASSLFSCSVLQPKFMPDFIKWVSPINLHFLSHNCFFSPLYLYLYTTRQANLQASIWTTISCCCSACLCFNSALFFFIYVLVAGLAACVLPTSVVNEANQSKIFSSLISYQTVKLGSAIKYKSRFDYSTLFVSHMWPAQLPENPPNKQRSSITTHRDSVTSPPHIFA